MNPDVSGNWISGDIIALIDQGMLFSCVGPLYAFFLLPLYDAIQTDSQLKISYKKGDAKILEGEQNKAKRTVRLWLSLSGN